jgi:hypothetical protein
MACDDDKIGKSAKWGNPRWDIPPWEQPGGFRFDSLPHRGPLLRRLANVAFVCSALSSYPLPGCCFLSCMLHDVFCIAESWIRIFGAAAILGLLGSCLGLVVWILARGDLEAMRTGLIDPEGKWETKFGRDRAVDSFGLGFCAFLLWGAPVLFACLWNR